MTHIRPAAQAGRFYPGSNAMLRQQVEQLLGAAASGAEFSRKAKEIGEGAHIRGVIAPHAGYTYSGSTAATAFAMLKGLHPRRVVVLAPSHYARFRGAASHSADAFKTPLGEIPLDREFLEHLESRYSFIRSVDEAHEEEHSIEVELPFLQVALGPFALVPLLLSDQKFAPCKQLAEALASVIREEEQGLASAKTGKPEKEAPARAQGSKESAPQTPTLIVASSDLYHGAGHEECVERDKILLEIVERGDAHAFCAAVESGRAMACGYGPITCALLASQALGANRVKVLHHTTSYDEMPVSEDYVVGYLSAALYSTG